MKAKILLLAIAILGSGLVYSQNENTEATKSCEKKVLKKIQRKMNFLQTYKYLEVGEKAELIITCVINEKNTVEVVEIKGYDEDLKKAVTKILEERPVKCDNQVTGVPFKFKMKFQQLPA
jgi:hypothetical protein